MKYLLDTNICIYLMKGKYPALADKILSLRPENVCISAITVYELEYGAAKSKWGSRTRQKMRVFLSPFNILPFTDKDAVSAGNIRSCLEAWGKPIGAYDILIAAQAISGGMTVITHNVQEFSRVPNLKTEDWTSSE